MRLMTILAAGFLSLAPALGLAETRLLMAEQPGCAWCERWDREVSAIYPKTPEGEAAPLERFDKTEGTPDGVTLARKIAFTPTFVLVRDGVEIDRMEGYPGEDFFWGLLGMMLDRAQIDYKKAG
ncbi:regulatory protein [Oceanicola sp. 22II-s10i]|uniref:hypothetical protein n=1 Tax=Oceanicola sp. 22II-s10i TaxID=1317116 RepID=UPI000B520F63|nr:hypothetical protein [Oceanicola sp. 22II-s10i]OWU83442.1 regulatory protein [Oceanicola sp. 22II-s10i]